MTRQSFVWCPVRKDLIPKDEYHSLQPRSGGVPTILPDLPDFVSPIDGKAYSGRAGLREHCVRHNVVPNAELKGLPPLQLNSDMRDPSRVKQDRAARKQQIINLVNAHR